MERVAWGGQASACLFCVFGVIPDFVASRMIDSHWRSGYRCSDRAGGVPPALFTTFVENVVVSGTKKDVRMRFVLRDGSEYKVDGVR